MVVSVEDCCDYLGIDYADDMVVRRLTALIATADAYLINAVGKRYAQVLSVEQLQVARELALMFIGELYDSRGMSAKEQNAASRLYASLLFQLQLECEGAEDESL